MRTILFVLLSFLLFQKPEHPEDGMIEVKRPGRNNLEIARYNGRINYYYMGNQFQHYLGYSICVDSKCAKRRYFWYKKFVTENMLK